MIPYQVDATTFETKWNFCNADGMELRLKRQDMTQLKTQLQNIEEIKTVLQEVYIAHSWENQTVDVRLIYLPCTEDGCDTISLFTIIKKYLMSNFVFSHAQIQKKLEINKPESEEELFKKAVRFISKKTAHGELGELLLFTLLEVYLGAPKILSKVSMKSSTKMPVHGADAVHAQYVNNQLRLYLGESKLYTSFKKAVYKAADSISTSRINYEHEFDLIETHMSFPEITKDLERELITILNPFEEHFDHASIMHFPCFIGFAEPNCFLDKDTYLDIYKKIALEYMNFYFSSLQNKQIDCQKTTLLMLPFSSISEVVKEFVFHMGINE